MTYPVEDVLPDLLGALRNDNNAVLIAPPGAGKTTMVAPALLNEKWCHGQILLLSPRRLAARMAAERIADLTKTKLGEEVGYATRMDSRQSKNTRILVLTEGIFRSRIIADPELAGVSAVLFDEVHERSIDSDFGLALALEAQGAFCPDLRLLAMSATLDGERFANLMAGEGEESARVIESEGKSWPLDIRYAGRRSELPLEQDMAAIIRAALRDEEGDILAFLPGVREIERTAERLSDSGVSAAIHLLHGQIDPAAQRRAVRADEGGQRKIILATNIAETSLTIDGVRIVVDGGMARRARYDRAAGVTRLITERASLSAATQRAGRAARQGPGVAIRLWAEAGNGGLPPFDPPEILESDLAPLLLDTARWGEGDPSALRWLDMPPAAGISEAKKRLLAFQAIDDSGHITAHGDAMAQLPVPPAMAHMMLTTAAMGAAKLGGEMAMLLSERGLGGSSPDLTQRLESWRRQRGGRAETAEKIAGGWAKKAQALAGALPANRAFADVALTPAMAVALAYPDRVSRRRNKSGENWQSVGGRGFHLDTDSPLTGSEWLAAADVQGAASSARIMNAAAISLPEIEALFAADIESGAHVSFNPDTGGVTRDSGRRLGAIKLSSGQGGEADLQQVMDALIDGVRQHGLDMLPWNDAATGLRARADWAGVDRLTDNSLLGSLDMWLAPLLAGKNRLGQISAKALYDALHGFLGWEAGREIDKLAPKEFGSPAGTRHAIDYAAEAGPTVTLRVQALFGLNQHPKVGQEQVPLVLSLTSPAGRPIQTTRDLPAFWAGSWRDVQKDMRGRYPKHNWPDDPASAKPSLATKKRQGI